MRNYISVQDLHQNDDMLLTPEEINEIAERISKNASERIVKELEKALKSNNKELHR